jgi:hypothetical protein
MGKPAVYERYYAHIKAWHAGLVSLAGVIAIAGVFSKSKPLFVVAGIIVVADLFLFAWSGLKTEFAREDRKLEK